jgi:hypothetical protein
MDHAQASITLNVYGRVVAEATEAMMDRVGGALSRAQAKLAASEKRAD